MKVEKAEELHSLRPLRCEITLLSQPDGSCSLHQGDTAMMAAVYGPRDVRQSAEIVDAATVDVVYQPAVGVAGTCANRFSEHLLLASCRCILLSALHPRTSVTVVIQEVTDDGSGISVAVNAACLCLLDAGLPMSQTVAAVCAAISPDGNIIIDPCSSAETQAVASMMFAFGSSDSQLLSCRAVGKYTDSQYHQALLSCREASKGVFRFYRQAICNKLRGAAPGVADIS